MKKMLKMFLIVMFLSVLVMPMVFAGGKQSSTVGTQISFWDINGRRDSTDPVIVEFMKKNPEVQIIPSYYSTDGIKDALKVAASSKTLPDMWFIWGGNLGGFYAENNLVYDLSAYAKSHNWDKVFGAGALQLCTLYGKLAGYPTSYNVISMFYRKDIFSRLNLSVPNTLEELEALSKVLKQNGVTPMGTGGLFGWHVMRYVEQLIEHYAGPDLHDKMSSFQSSHANDAVIKALTKYKEWVDNGFFPQGFVTTDPDDSLIDIFAGRVAMVMEGQWYDSLIIKNEQNMSNFGAFPFPSNSKRFSAFADMIQYNVNISPEKLNIGINLMDYYYSPEAITKFGTYNAARLDAVVPSNQINVSSIFNASSRYGTFTITDQAFPTEVADELFRVQDGIALNQITPQQGAPRIQAAVDAYLKNK